MTLGAVLAVALILNVFPGVRRAVSDAAGNGVSAVVNAVTPRDHELDAAKRARIQAEQQAAQVKDADAVVAEAQRLVAGYAESDRQLIVGRAISFTPVIAAGDARRVQLDIGSDDGVRVSSAVVAAGGLVGRVTGVSAETCVVTLLTDPSSVVGGRVERSSALARVAGKAPEGVAAPPIGSVNLVVTEGGSVTKGDRIVTAGSPGDRPYPSGIPVGTVTSVDADRGQLERRAVVRPAVNLSSLDVVAVMGASS